MDRKRMMFYSNPHKSYVLILDPEKLINRVIVWSNLRKKQALLATKVPCGLISINIYWEGNGFRQFRMLAFFWTLPCLYIHILLNHQLRNMSKSKLDLTNLATTNNYNLDMQETWRISLVFEEIFLAIEWQEALNPNNKLLTVVP